MSPPSMCEHPIFIIGSPRSGTSILAWSLAQHSQLWTSAESDILYHLFGNNHLNDAYRKTIDRPDGSWLKAQKVSRKEFYEFLGIGLNALFTSRSGGRRWIDQSPTYTLIADQLLDLFPGAYFLHMLRDGRNVVNSMIHSGFETHWAHDFTEACRAWCHYARIGLRLADQHPDRCLTVTNEALSKDAESEFQRIFEFVNVPVEGGPANHFRSNKINSSFRSEPRQSPSKDCEVWGGWSAEQRACFTREAAGLLIDGGYALESEFREGLVRNAT